MRPLLLPVVTLPPTPSLKGGGVEERSHGRLT